MLVGVVPETIVRRNGSKTKGRFGGRATIEKSSENHIPRFLWYVFLPV